ncbi:MAG: VWA domain-containing protein [Gammaproteobacteria bacterium]|nr:VWA domain-containing protein [Gammaproteobacteria bacterium]MCF6259821.1 VWA domain-containing protein [Gammaproteobacteria bacterium]
MKSLYLEEQFQFLDALPETLFDRVVTLAYGNLQERVRGILFWREHLLRGSLPPVDDIFWPEPDIANIIHQRLHAVELLPLCHDEESLVDQILQDICTAIESILQRQAHNTSNLFDDILAQQPPKNTTNSHQSEQNTVDDNPPATIEFNNLEDVAKGLEQQWIKLVFQWKETRETFSSMGTRLGRGWDLSKGILTTAGWHDFIAYRKLIHDHPQLKKVISILGQKQQTVSAHKRSRISTTSNNTLITAEKPVKTESPLSTQGVTRSGDIARMLPQEAVFLGHPKLHMLWHARRAENALLSYRVEGVLSDHQPDIPTLEKSHRYSAPADTRKKGPIILCIDTSGSMHGEPERLAKAICLEVIRQATRLKQPCLLFAFSGPGQLLEQSLSFDRNGLRPIIRFLQQTFHGGTDIREPFARALEKITERHWQHTDILLVSDGRFPVPEHLTKKLADAQKREGLRVFGITVGHWSSSSMEAVCQTVYRVNTKVSV